MKHSAWWTGKMLILSVAVAFGMMSLAVAQDEAPKADEAKAEVKQADEIAKEDAGEKAAEVKEEAKKDEARPAAAARGGQQRGSMGRTGAMGGKFWEREGVKEQLKLTDEQIKKLNDGYAATDAEITKISQEMRANWQSRREAGETIDDAKKAEMDKKTQELRTQLEALNAKRQEVVKSVLSEEQMKAYEKMQSEARTRRTPRGEGRVNQGENASPNAPDAPKAPEAPKKDAEEPK